MDSVAVWISGEEVWATRQPEATVISGAWADQASWQARERRAGTLAEVAGRAVAVGFCSDTICRADATQRPQPLPSGMVARS
jgi:hypothetical protein